MVDFGSDFSIIGLDRTIGLEKSDVHSLIKHK